jgi:hypothetical protein
LNGLIVEHFVEGTGHANVGIKLMSQRTAPFEDAGQFHAFDASYYGSMKSLPRQSKPDQADSHHGFVPFLSFRAD